MPAIKAVFENIYQGKTILITGDTGFKGSWLSIWLKLLGAKVVGYSAYLPSNPCLFSACNINNHIKHIQGDIRDYDALKKVFKQYEFDFVFHLAAQPIVTRAYLDPKATFETNILGTVNVLECVRKFSDNAVAVMITSDKCYKNMGWSWGYRETDHLGGNDPYSASKACAELVCQSYVKSFSDRPKNAFSMATARAGNVIGGGDWAIDRIIPDCIRAWSNNKAVYIRNPKATRPWQHVLEPLSGYLWLAQKLSQSNRLNGESFNFGPDYKDSASVGELIKIFSKYFGGNNKWRYLNKAEPKESMFLKVSSDKALKYLDWYAVLPFSDTIKMTAEWYKNYYKKHSNTSRSKGSEILDFTIGQIKSYIDEAQKNNLKWASE